MEINERYTVYKTRQKHILLKFKWKMILNIDDKLHYIDKY